MPNLPTCVKRLAKARRPISCRRSAIFRKTCNRSTGTYFIQYAPVCVAWHASANRPRIQFVVYRSKEKASRTLFQSPIRFRRSITSNYNRPARWLGSEFARLEKIVKSFLFQCLSRHNSLNDTSPSSIALHDQPNSPRSPPTQPSYSSAGADATDD